MSRCFPYPPPGYTLSRARNEALIESIKLQKEKQRKKEKKEKRKEKRKEKKEKRKEKKEKRKEKKEKRKEKKDKTNQNSDKPDIAKHHIIQKSSSDANFDFLHKKREAEIEHLERSSLTEEHACPASLSVPSTSSDSTQNSNKRTRHSLPIDDTCGHGKFILIRLPSKKQNEFDALAKEEQQPCSTSRRSDSTAKIQDVDCVKDLPDNRLKGTSDIDHGLNIGNKTRQICSTSGQIEAGKTGNKSVPKPVLLTPMQKMDLQYKNLLENCFPPQSQDACFYPDDLDWLLKGRNLDDQGTRAEKKRRFGSDGFSCSRSSGLWPRAEYLCEVDVYAMPFTVPY